MSTDRTVTLGPGDLALKLACREAVLAAGGQEFAASEAGRTQSRISDYLSPNTADFMPIDVVRRIEALGAGRPGHPHVTRALARAQGQLVLRREADRNDPGAPLSRWLAQVVGESADVIEVLAAGLVAPAQSIAEMAPAERQRLAGEIDQLIDVLAGMQAQLAPGR